MNINAINNINFGQKRLGTINTENNSAPLNFVEYDYGFYDMLHIRDQVDSWQPAKSSGGKNLYNRFCDYYMSGEYLKRYFGVEDDNGNIKAIVEADVKADKANSEEFGTIKPSKVAFNPDVEETDTPKIKKEIKREIEKHSDNVKGIFAQIIDEKQKMHSFYLDEDGNLGETELKLNA